MKVEKRLEMGRKELDRAMVGKTITFKELTF